VIYTSQNVKRFPEAYSRLDHLIQSRCYTANSKLSKIKSQNYWVQLIVPLICIYDRIAHCVLNCHDSLLIGPRRKGKTFQHPHWPYWGSTCPCKR